MTKFEHVSYRAKDYRRHVHQLAAAFGVLIMENPRAEPHAAYAALLMSERKLPLDKRQRMATFRPVRDETSYAVAMHELGHAVAPGGILPYERDPHKMTLSDMRLQMHCEEVAWEWAIAMSLQWTPLMDAVKDLGLKTYQRRLRFFERKHKRSTV